MSYKNTRMKDAFTRDEIRTWKVHRFMRNSTRWVGGQRCTGEVPVHAFWTYVREGNICYKYHQTEIVRYEERTGIITLKTNGYDTAPTTKKHLAEAVEDLPLPPTLFPSFSSRKGTLYVHWLDFDLEFEEGMTLNTADPAGQLQGYLPYGSFTWDDCMLKYHFEDMSFDWSIIRAKLGKLPKNPDTFKLKAKYGFIPAISGA